MPGSRPLASPEGLERLGGIDFDEALFRRAMAMVAAQGVTIDADEPATMAAIARLRDECRRAKEALSSDTDATVAVFLPGLQTEMRVTRPEFEDMIRPRIHETIEALGRAARSAGVGYDEIDRVLLVGGSSRIPLVAEMVRDATGRPVAVDAHPKHTMALGAAHVAQQRAGAVGVGGAALGTAAAAGAAIPAGSEPTATAADPTAPDTRPEVAAAPSAAAAAAAADGVAIAADFSTAETRSMDAPDAAPAPLTASGAGASGVRPRRMLPVGLAIAGVAVVAAVAIAASNMLGGGGGAPTASPAPSIAIVPSASPSPSIATPSPSPVVTPSPSPSPSLAPTPTPTPAGRQARITSITVSGGRYLVDYDVFNFTPKLPNDRHVHFFFDTVTVANAGVPGKGPWELYAGPVPFDVYRVSDKPSGARQMCVLVARADHSVVQDTGNCVDLPS